MSTCHGCGHAAESHNTNKHSRDGLGCDKCGCVSYAGEMGSAPKPSFYQRSMLEEAARIGRTDVDVRHIEAFMRLEHPTLSALSTLAFADEVGTAIRCIDASEPEENEKLARSFGL